MLNFKNITSTGYTVIREGGLEEVKTGRLFNNETYDAHIIRENNMTYELFLDKFIARGDKICVYAPFVPQETWNITHNFDAGVIVHVLRDDGLMLYPKNILIIDSNHIKLDFDTKIAGRAIVRVV